MFKEARNSIQDEDMTGMVAMVSTPEMMDSVNAFILADGGVSIGNIPEQLRFSMKLYMMILPFIRLVVGWLGFYSISTIVGYLTTNPFLYK